MFYRLWKQGVWYLRHGHSSPKSWSSASASTRASPPISTLPVRPALICSALPRPDAVPSVAPRDATFSCKEFDVFFSFWWQALFLKRMQWALVDVQFEVSHLCIAKALSCWANIFNEENAGTFKFCWIFQKGSPMFIGWHIGNNCTCRWQLVGLTGAALPQAEPRDYSIAI